MDNLALWDHYLAYTYNREETAACDLDTGRVISVAKRRQPGRDLFWVAGHGTTVVYSEVDTTTPTAENDPLVDPTGLDPTVRLAGMAWSIHGYDLATGKRRELARSHGEADTELFVVPVPTVEGRWVAWRQPTGGPTGEKNQYKVVSYDLKTSRARTLGGGVGPGTLSLAGGIVYFNALDERNPPHLMLWSAKADGSAPQAVVPGGDDVLESDVHGSLATWASYVARSPRAEDERFPIVARKLGSSRKAVTLGRAYRSTSTGTLVMWVAFDASHKGKAPSGLTVADPDYPDRPLNLAPEASALAGDGDLIAWTYHESGKTRVRIDHVVRRG